MGIFANNKALRTLANRLEELSTEVRELKSAHKHLELEWEELYDKVRHQMSRMSRRATVDLKDNGMGVVDAAINAQQDLIDPISAKILERRNRGIPPQ